MYANNEARTKSTEITEMTLLLTATSQIFLGRFSIVVEEDFEQIPVC